MGDFIYEQFKERVRDFGIELGPEDKDGNIEITRNGGTSVINLGNARASYLQHGDLTHLDMIVSSV